MPLLSQEVSLTFLLQHAKLVKRVMTCFRPVNPQSELLNPIKTDVSQCLRHMKKAICPH